MYRLTGTVVYSDVDSTLIFPDFDSMKSEKELVNINGRMFLPNYKIIEELKLHKVRGHKVAVWSKSGEEWAYQVVIALKLLDYVDLTVSKPFRSFDDLPPEEFMPKSTFFR